MNAFWLSKIFLPLWQRYNGQTSLKVLKELETNQWLSPEAIADLQWQKLDHLLRYVYANVPFYRDLMREQAITPDMIVSQRRLGLLPIMDKAIINQHRDQLIAENLPPGHLVPNSTGGSTGEPFKYYEDREELRHKQAPVWLSESWCGVGLGERRAYFWGASFDLMAYQGLKGKFRSRMLNRLMMPAWRLSVETSPIFLQELIRFRPRLLVAYTGALYEWARLLGFRRQPIPGLKAIVVSAETLYDDWREAIEQTFGVPVFNRYGGRDSSLVAQECEQHGGLHISAMYVYVEVVRDGKPVAPGELGEIAITRLNKLAMPFIRYLTGDLGVLSDATCTCGRGLPLLARVEGRMQDAIRTPDGRVISGLLFPHLMKDCSEVKAFQIHQMALDHLVIKVVTNPARALPSRDRIARVMRDYMGENVRIEYEFVDEIPATRSGKRRISISHL